MLVGEQGLELELVCMGSWGVEQGLGWRWGWGGLNG